MGLLKAIRGENTIEGYDYDNIFVQEGERLRVQMTITRNFDLPVLKEIFANRKGVTVLDVGCNEGDQSMDRLTGFDVTNYIGIDRSTVAIEKATEKYKDDITHFYRIDVSSEMFPIELTGVLQRNHIDRVDVIICSMVLLHLEDPAEVLKQLYPFLNPGGVIFVRDIDDRDNCAEPDPNHTFDRGYAIVDRCKDSGNRHTGRNIGKWLTAAGFSNVRRVRKGLSSMGMTNDEKLALYETYFGFFMPDAEARVEEEPNNEHALADLGWCHYYLPKIKDIFLMPGFTFTLGFTTYIATKE